MISLLDLLGKFSFPAVRDLAGVIASPSLIADRPDLIGDAECARMLEEAMPRLLELDRDPSPLLAWFDATGDSPLLGRYFEALVGYWIRGVLGARRVEAGLKVLRGRAEVGELDFVFEPAAARAQSGVPRLQHWEVSVKFYLCVGGRGETATGAGGRAGGGGSGAAREGADGGDPRRATAFLGTMTRDRLDLKMERVFERQLPRAHSVEGLETLRRAGFTAGNDGADRPLSRALFKGALFYPAESDWRTHAHPPEVSSAHLRGWWSARLPESVGQDTRWVVLDRRRWLSPVLAPVSASAREECPAWGLLSRSELLDRVDAHFREQRTAFMVAEVVRDGSWWRELNRGLVVHPGWPWPVKGV